MLLLGRVAKPSKGEGEILSVNFALHKKLIVSELAKNLLVDIILLMRLFSTNHRLDALMVAFRSTSLETQTS